MNDVTRRAVAGNDGAAPAPSPRPCWSVLGLVLALGAGFVYLNRAQLPAAASAVRQAEFVFLAGASGGAALYLLNQAAMYQAAYRAAGLRLPYGRAFRLASAAHFLNSTVVNSGGMAGLAPFLGDAARRGQNRGVVVSAYLLISLLGHFVFAALLAGALLLAASDRQVTKVELVATGVFAVYALSSAGLLVAAARSRAALRRLHAAPGAVLAAARRLLRLPPRDRSGSHEAADELYDAIGVMLARPGALLVPVAHAFAVEAIGVLTLWLSLRAFGLHTGLEEPLIAYAIGVLFAIVGFLPAGLGFAEAGLGVALASFGFDGVRVALVVVTYRLFEVWVPLIVGAVCFQLGLRERRPL